MARIETRERAENPAQFAENTKNLGLGRIPHQATATNPALHDVDAVRDHVKDAWRAGLNALGDPHPLIVGFRSTESETFEQPAASNRRADL